MMSYFNDVIVIRVCIIVTFHHSDVLYFMDQNLQDIHSSCSLFLCLIILY